MKNTLIKIFVFIFLLISNFAFSQIKEILKTNNKKSDQVLVVEPDSVAILEAKKKIAAEENAKLPKPYNEQENAEDRIAALVKQAQKENKNIILQAGGNWCIWCLRFNQFVQTTPELKNIVDKNYLYYHLNYSPKNKNEKVFAKYDNPGNKFGYPVFIVLDSNGKMIHIQDSAVLEEGKGYNLEKVKDFFLQFTPQK